MTSFEQTENAELMRSGIGNALKLALPVSIFLWVLILVLIF